ncbi:MAG TPA: D-Ala-D-Ala carboxypeptidase family metallohydrolase [Steroidobacteraceae bacterium]|nr:D-Ala-D-Ala carboxypeptidase family metallohydrolase [Steroidobacteraceae bacterium]
MQLSRFFTLEEMTHSDTAVRRGIANQPDADATNNLKTLCTAVLDPLRDAVGTAINVSSGYRGPELNAAIGGATKSQHMEGKAADLQSRVISILELFKTVIRNGLPYDQVIYEAKDSKTKWVHVSHDPARARGQILVADFDGNGKVARYRAITVQEALALTDPTEPVTRSRSGPVELHYEELPDEPGLDAEAGETAPDPEIVATEATPGPRPPPKTKPTKPAPVAKPAAAAKPKPAAKKKKAPARKKATSRKKTPAKKKSAPKRKAAAKKTAAQKKSAARLAKARAASLKRQRGRKRRGK